jgi:hypothetical protein
MTNEHEEPLSAAEMKDALVKSLALTQTSLSVVASICARLLAIVEKRDAAIH